MLARFLSSPDTDGTFDYFSNILTLLNYDEQDSDDVYAALNWKNGTLLDRKTLKIRALIYHEITHFLDLHTTMWGHQYVARKLSFVEALTSASQAVKDRLDVFAIETGEIDIHDELIVVGGVDPQECFRLTHTIKHHPKFGLIILINYGIGDQIHYQIPLSTLSLLETHATANELLSRFKYASSLDDPVEAAIVNRETSEILDNLLNDKARLEYSVLLRLAKTHFAELSTEGLMSFVSVLSRFSLDITFQTLGIIANRIEESFENQHFGHFLSMELRRDSQRSLIFFKSILFMYEWKESLIPDEQQRYLAILESDPASAISEMWVRYKGMSYEDFDEPPSFILETNLKIVKGFKTPLCDAALTLENVQNRKVLSKYPIGAAGLAELKLCDIALDDGTPIQMPNAINIDMIKHFDDNMKLFSQMERLYKDNKESRIHMPPDTIEFYLF